ncbi:orotidine 5'-phosphate decarboxylase [Nocardioides flavus (ex Wang et al. 2016)]|uniref:Orotidine 5'-phosphate decarboxylase n=1 Tax=Nocardioides flavus (ex Wang et al. 2016) TaxID=2058780 RepID=A0ABQ3HDZ6_9ACTN|nr:orotidine-5'-phosphate decarboxylase [Nocardioides flavus (ex Wang et al. 2016)]GHE15505.1 orotidine 5'-phosphate decarboxylase [Nocardioides flavus (ex Wang et al. 2016)]
MLLVTSGGQIVVALDFDHSEPAMDVVRQLGDLVGTYKVGLELLTAAGPAVVSALVESGKQVFLDLKLNEIPHSVASAIRVCGDLGVSMVTVHAGAGSAVLRAAVEAARATPRLKVLALTVITSLADVGLVEVGVPGGVQAQVERLAGLAIDAGCHGLVTSPCEVRGMRALAPPHSLIVVPGAAVPGDVQTRDHVRAGTVGGAIADGASHVIVGRGVTRAEDPYAAVEAALHSMSRA